MNVHDSRGLKRQQCGGIIREGTAIVKRRVVPASIKPQLEKPGNSNDILLRIPIEISNSARGEKSIAVAEAPLSSILSLSQQSPGYRMLV